MSRPYRFAVIGTGFFAQNHLNAWAEIPEVELVAVCDIDADRVNAAAATFGGRAYTDAVELFANEELDFVDIATTPPTHRMMVELAAAHGVAPICQKPLAWDMDDAKAMVRACADRDLPFMVHENFRFQHPMRRIKQLLDDGAIGRPFFGRISFRTAHDVYSAQPWLVDSERMIIVDVAVHLFDLATCFVGEPRTLFTDALTVNPRIAGEDVATVLMHMDDATCIVDASYETRSDHNTYPQTFVVLEGTEGTITLGPDYHLQVVSRGTVREEDLVIPDHGWTSEPWNAIQDSVYTIQRHWIDCLTDGPGAGDIRCPDAPAARRHPRRLRVARLRRALHRREPVLTVLHAGPLTLRYSAGDLRDIRLAGDEIVRRIYMVFQDRNWTARPWTILEEDIQSGGDSFTVELRARGSFDAAPFTWTGRLTGSPDGTIRYAIDGGADAPMVRNRLGLCVLHPADLAGRPATLETVDGDGPWRRPSPSRSPRTSRSADMRALTHEVAPGAARDRADDRRDLRERGPPQLERRLVQALLHPHLAAVPGDRESGRADHPGRGDHARRSRAGRALVAAGPAHRPHARRVPAASDRHPARP